MMYLQNLNENLDINNYGGKAASLSYLISHNISVPPGFAIKKNAFKAYLDNNNFIQTITADIQAYLVKLKSKKLMVRSSAIGEDSPEHSFAGQLDSFQVDNDIDSVIVGIKKCWESMNNQRLTTYQELDDNKLSEMAVIIQEMIDPDFAGVLFTSSPMNDGKIYLEYVSGHAESLVQGEVTPHSLQFDNFSVECPTQPMNFKQLLNESHNILKAYNNIPQDIEWAYKDDIFYFVQSRPITTLKERIKWSNTNVNENYPDKLSPLLYSIAKQSYYHYYKNLALSFYTFKKENSSYEKYFANAIGCWGHRMYYNMSSIHHIIQLSPSSKMLNNSFNDFIGYQKKNSIGSTIGSYSQKTKFYFMILFHLFKLSSYVKFIEKRVHKYSTQFLHSNSLLTLTNAFHCFLHIRFHLWIKASFADFYSMLFHGLLGKLVSIVEPIKYQGVQNSLIQAIPGLISNQPLIQIWQIHKLIEQNENFEELFSRSPSKILSELNDKPLYKDLQMAIQQYLTDWGYRCSGELTFLSENYIDKPESLIEIIKAFRKNKPEDPKALIAKKSKEKDVLLKSICKKFRQHYKFNLFKKFTAPILLKVIIKLTTFSISCRERVRLKQAQMYYTFKKNCLNIGGLLQKNKILTLSSDIFYLTYNEINILISGESTDPDYIKELVCLRKKSQAKSRVYNSYVESFREEFGLRIIPQPKKQENTSGLYQGIPACGGKVTGKIKILENVHEIKKLKKGDILVTKQTDPGWICAFPLIAGLIVENGGMLSHGAIVSREYGIPAVVGIENITRLLNEQQTIHLDGDMGTVRCLD